MITFDFYSGGSLIGYATFDDRLMIWGSIQVTLPRFTFRVVERLVCDGLHHGKVHNIEFKRRGKA